MKTILCSTEKFLAVFSLKLIALLLCFFIFTAAEAGNKGIKKDVKSLKVQLERAEAAYQKNLQKKLLADSLLNLGEIIHDETSDEIRAAIIYMNNKAKVYTKQMKKFEKGLRSNSLTEVSQARASIKALDDDYNQSLKEFDMTMKNQIIVSDEGTRQDRKSVV